mgnify:CR=1 FL=1
MTRNVVNFVQRDVTVQTCTRFENTLSTWPLPEQRIYLMLNYATLYQRFKHRIYITLNYTLNQMLGYLKQLTLRVYIVHCPQLIPNKTHNK